ncbi:MAG: hypothetical protein MJK15_01580 [Colwellia sp.]|nr:hypothetical protein [Colwellia sp.]
MNKNILAAVIFASLSAITLPAQAMDIDPAAQLIIDNALANDCNFDIEATKNPDIEATESCELNAILIAAIIENPALADSLLAAAIAVVGANTEAAETLVASAIFALGVDSPLIANLLKAATESGVDADTLTAVAIANGVDATIASEATAAGNTGNNNGNTTTTTTTNRGNAGGGGGGEGISGNQ